jgi:hypothetical protein
MALTAYFEIEAHDIVRVQRLLLREMFFGSGAGILLVLLLAALLALLSSIGGAGAKEVVIGVPLFLVLLVILQMAMQSSSARRLREGSALYQEEQHFTFSPESLRTSTRLTTSEYQWRAFERVRETKEYFLFYLTKRRALFLPQRALTSAADRDALRAMIAEAMQPLGRRFEAYDPAKSAGFASWFRRA